MYCLFFFFFFKQKTAYEMRISDWSSDVCSSDLEAQVSHSPLLICDAESASERSAVDRRTNLPRRYFFMRILIVVMLADRRTTDCPGAGRNILAVTTADLMADHTPGDCAPNRRSTRMTTGRAAGRDRVERTCR